jgi:guanidinoacetate N-methyltransferase
MKKTKQFLSQIPNWEEKYKKTDDEEIDFKKSDWLNAPAKFTKHDLKIFGCAVMEDWEKPYMKDLAKVACSSGGTILELGFGMAISAKFIQKEKITKHIIIEANKEVADEARKFAKKAKHETLVLEGFWEDMIKKIPNNSLDGILFDTYPLSDKELYQNHFFFFPFAYKKLKKGGIFTYYSDEINTFGKVHLQKLQKAGFKKENINSKVCKISPPKNCEYWKADTMLTPIIKK